MISILTLSAMLLHVLLGCCAHHAHAVPDGHALMAEHAATASPVHDTGCCHGHHATGSVDPADEPNNQPLHDNCEEDSCNYVGSSKVELPSAEDSVWADLALRDSASIALLSRSSSAHGEAPVDWGRTLTLRLHALHRVWLI